jgi:hypothetical protein
VALEALCIYDKYLIPILVPDRQMQEAVDKRGSVTLLQHKI